MREHASGTPIVSVAPYFGQRDSFADATIENDPEHLVAGLREFLLGREGTSKDGKAMPDGVPAAKPTYRRSRPN
jgi:hypothetical protein